MRRAVEPVDRLGRDAERGVEAEAHVGHRDVVVDRLGEGDDVQPLLHQVERILLSAAAAQADQRVEVAPVVVFDDHFTHVHYLAPDLHSLWLLPVRSENRAADREDARKIGRIEHHCAIFHHSAKPVAKADDAHAVRAESRLSDSPNRGVQTRGVSPGCQYSYALCHRAPHQIPLETPRRTSAVRQGLLLGLRKSIAACRAPQAPMMTMLLCLRNRDRAFTSTTHCDSDCDLQQQDVLFHHGHRT